MASSSNRDHFFQTTSSLEEVDRKSRKASNTHGNPIKLPSKILAVTSNPYNEDGSIYVAESAATVKKIALTDGKVSKTLRGPAAPLTSLCLLPDSSVLAGCWDKTTWQFPSPGTQAATSAVQYSGHTDFVKCVLYVQLADKCPLIISGDADGDLLFWTPSPTPSRYLQRISPQSRAIESIALDPLSTPDAPVVFLSTSQREIYTLTLPSTLSMLKSSQLSPPILAHETSVYKLHFDSDGDLWTASADKTSKHLVRENNWAADTTLTHPDFVRDVIVHERYGWVITACRDEEVRVWNRATGNLHHTFSGHFEEVTGLCLMGDTVVSVSIDATVRRWDVGPANLKKAIDDAKNPEKAEPEEEQKSGDANEFGLTEEEEAELRAMMNDEESEGLDKMAKGDQ